MDKVRVFEAFCGYGSHALALERLKADYPEKFDFEVVGISVIEKYPLMAYQALHGHCPNFGDITKIDWEQVPDFDLLTYSLPCQSISLAGKKDGLAEDSGTRSSLLWECKRAISEKKPKWLLMESDEELSFKKNLPQLQKWLLWLKQMGYISYTEVLEATDYGVPQKRRSFFCVSVRTDSAPKPYYFPLPIGNGDLQKIFEKDVPSEYDVRDLWFERLKKDYPKDYKKLLSDKFLKASAGCRTNVVVSDWTKKKYVYEHNGDFIRVRKLTPREGFRLMGLRDSDIDKIQAWRDEKGKSISDNAQRAMAGNSIVVDVLYHIFRKLYVVIGCDPYQQMKLF